MIMGLLRLLVGIIVHAMGLALRVSLLLGTLCARLVLVMLQRLHAALPRRTSHARPAAPPASSVPPAERPVAPTLPAFKPRPLHPRRRR